MKRFPFLILALSCFAGDNVDLPSQPLELATDSYCDKAEFYTKRDYEETYFLISSCLEGYFGENWSTEEITEAHVLDYGCGTGASTRLLKSFGFEDVLGIDPSVPMVEKAIELEPLGNFSLLSPDFDWNEWKGRFDLVSSSFVFPVLSNPEELNFYLQNAYLALKDDGVLVIVTAAVEAFDPKYTWLSWEQNFPENYSAIEGEMVSVRLKKGGLLLHDTLWSSEFLQKVLKDNSFQVEHLFRPLGRPEESFPWQSELSISPFDIYILKKCRS